MTALNVAHIDWGLGTSCSDQETSGWGSEMSGTSSASLKLKDFEILACGSGDYSMYATIIIWVRFRSIR